MQGGSVNRESENALTQASFTGDGVFLHPPQGEGVGTWCSHDLVCQAQNYRGDYGEEREASMCSVRDKCASVQCAVG